MVTPDELAEYQKQAAQLQAALTQKNALVHWHVDDLSGRSPDKIDPQELLLLYVQTVVVVNGRVLRASMAYSRHIIEGETDKPTWIIESLAHALAAEILYGPEQAESRWGVHAGPVTQQPEGSAGE